MKTIKMIDTVEVTENDIKNGLYKIHWKDGEWSFAILGRDVYNRVWFATSDSNKIDFLLDMENHFKYIEKIEIDEQ